MKDSSITILEKFVLSNREALYRYAYGYVKNAEDASDIFQESIEKAIRSIKSLNDVSNLKCWFYRILSNTAIDFLRKNRRVVYVDFLEEYEALAEEESYDALSLEEALDKIPASLRAIVTLRFYDDMKLSEIAEVMDMNVNTVKTQLYRALKLLKMELEVE
ncbi:MAG: polymerase sigma-70 factor, subfamily [Clostridiales bacterium]|jgi:RNA polymerase sigma-70 factor (ECF subfamily)|nr:polymerase sigma-70 factor, subfamily [Clostridiales bacterium]